MPKENYFNRYAHIIKRLEKGPATFTEISNYLQQQSSIFDIDLDISQRTFQRDIKEIYSLLGYDIQSEKTGNKRYFIADRPEAKQHTQRLLESFQIMNALKNAHGFQGAVLLETRKPNGLDHFHGLLYAINEKRIITFEYIKFEDDIVTIRTVHPLALKESQGRWYLVGMEIKANQMKVFGLDRINALDIHKTLYRTNYVINLEAHFKPAFGINTENNTESTKIQLKFAYTQGQYIKSFPLHESQIIIDENSKEVVIGLSIYITWDFIKELLSWGPDMEVISPATLKTQVKSILKKTLKQYD